MSQAATVDSAYDEYEHEETGRNSEERPGSATWLRCNADEHAEQEGVPR